MNQYGQLEENMLICECTSGVCGLHSLKNYLINRHIRSRGEFLFVHEQGSGLRDSTIRKWVKESIQTMNMDPEYFSGHSLRSGGATELLLQGHSLSVIEKLGRWAKDSKSLRQRYIQLPLTSHLLDNSESIQ